RGRRSGTGPRTAKRPTSAPLGPTDHRLPVPWPGPVRGRRRRPVPGSGAGGGRSGGPDGRRSTVDGDRSGRCGPVFTGTGGGGGDRRRCGARLRPLAAAVGDPVRRRRAGPAAVRGADRRTVHRGRCTRA